jgi:methylmalonyl-CoA mutase N-terminal domain/subunit
LKALEQAVKEKKNVMPFLVHCCRAYCTVGEMTRVFKEAYGEFEEPRFF